MIYFAYKAYGWTRKACRGPSQYAAGHYHVYRPTICWAFWCMYCRALSESAADHCQLQKSHLAITTCIEKRLLVIPIVEGYMNFLLVSRGRGCIRVIVLYLSISIVLLTAWLHEPFRSASDHSKRSRHCRNLHAEALQATVSEGLAQGPYVAARVGFEPTTLRSKGIDSINVPPHPKYVLLASVLLASM